MTLIVALLLPTETGNSNICDVGKMLNKILVLLQVNANIKSDI